MGTSYKHYYSGQCTFPYSLSPHAQQLLPSFRGHTFQFPRIRKVKTETRLISLIISHMKCSMEQIKKDQTQLSSPL